MESLHDHRRKLKARIRAQRKELKLSNNDLDSHDFFAEEPSYLYRNTRKDVQSLLKNKLTKSRPGLTEQDVTKKFRPSTIALKAKEFIACSIEQDTLKLIKNYKPKLLSSLDKVQSQGSIDGSYRDGVAQSRNYVKENKVLPKIGVLANSSQFQSFKKLKTHLQREKDNLEL